MDVRIGRLEAPAQGLQHIQRTAQTMSVLARRQKKLEFFCDRTCPISSGSTQSLSVLSDPGWPLMSLLKLAQSSRRNPEERHAGAGVPREARGRRVGRKELRWARKEKKTEEKERKKERKKERREKGEEGGVLTRCAARSVWLSLNQEPPIFFHKSPSSRWPC